MPDFERAAAKHDVPLPLLLTLGYFGSHFENRGDAPTIEGGYGVMALRANNVWHSDSLGEGAGLTKVPKERIIVDPGRNIEAAATVLSAYADQMKIDRSKGLEAWLYPVIKYAGLDAQYSRMFAMEIFDKLVKGLDYVNSAGEAFQFDAQDIGNIDLAKLQPTSAVRAQDYSPLMARPLQTPSSNSYSPMTAQYPPATWYAAASCNYQTGSYSKNTVIVHTAEGSAAGTLAWFNNCSAQVSAHYVVSEAGGVWQCVDEWYRAWHVGCANNYCIGIEHEGYAASASHPVALYNASGLLTRDICDSWGIPKSHNACPPGVLGHVDINNCVCGPGHTDPGAGWDWGYYMGVVNGTTWINPPYLFGDGTDGWTSGNSVSGIAWTGAGSWNGSMYFDQTGNDAFVYSPAQNFTGVYAPQVVNVNFYPQSGTTAAHDMQLFWKTNAENAFAADKSTPLVNYNAQNSWATVNLYINNSKYWGQTVNQMRLDFDNTNSSTRYIVNHFVLQNAPWWHFDTGGDVMGWYAGNAMTAPWQTSGSWPGCLVSDQTGNDGYILSPPIGGGGYPYNYLGGVNDWVHVRVFPQNGSTTAHDMGLYWVSQADGAYTESKSSHVTFNAKDGWADVYFPVGQNANWPAAHITQLRLDFDQTNHGNRWIVDYITMEYFGADTTVPSVPTGLTATAASQTVVNLAWTASTDNTGVNGYKVFRNGAQIATSIAPSYSDTTCSAGTAYSYTVSAYDSVANNSAQSTVANVTTPSGDTQAPSVPTNLAATATSATSVNLTWTASTDNVGVTGYKIYRGGTQVGTSATTSFSNTGLTQLTTYTYTVSAYDAAGNNSAQSTSANATTWDGLPPSVPAGLTATAATPTRVNLSWSASTDNVGVTGYKIYRGGAYVTTVTTLTYVDTGRSPSTAYTYTVSAIDARSNESAQSTVAGATTPAFSDIILDNGVTTLVGAWSTATASTDKYGADYLFASTAVTETKTATWTPTIAYPGNYNVYVWYAIGSNRATNSPYTTVWDGGNGTVAVNQTVTGGQWVLLQSSRHFLSGTAGYVRLGNGTGATGKVVIADAVRFLQISGD